MQEKEIERWITVNGKHIPIRKGQSVEEALKEKQIAQNEKEAQQKNAEKQETKYKDDLDYDTFVEKNLESLKAKYKADRNFEPKDEWRRFRLEQEKKDLHEVDIEDAIKTMRENIPSRIHEGWFRAANSDYKPILTDYVLANPGTLNAAMNMAYYNYRYNFERYSEYEGKWIPHEGVDQSKKLSFKAWLNTPQTMYRGHRGQQTVKSDIFSSYTPDKKMAEKFMGYDGKGKLETISIKPIETLGSYQTTAEAEYLIPMSILRKMGK